MKRRQEHFRNASFLALLFMVLGYAVKFFPEQVAPVDQVIQSNLRGELSSLATRFWTSLTTVGNPPVMIGLTAALTLFFFWKKWRAEALFTAGGMIVFILVSTGMKYLYMRPRPSLEWLVRAHGYSFPSGHAGGTMMLAGIIAIILAQRLTKVGVRRTLQCLLILLAIGVALSRVYVGVHYPTDILGGWLLSGTMLSALYPFYDEWRFTWRFQGKQK